MSQEPISQSVEGEVKPKRAPRRRVAASAVGEVSKRAPRKRATTKKTAATVAAAPAEDLSESAVETISRKAPTRLKPPSSAAPRRGLYIVLATLIFGIGGSVLIGLSDAGQINPTAVISDRNERIVSGQETQMEDKDGNIVPAKVVVPVQNTDRTPNGGLVPMNPADIPAPAPTATTTDEQATSTATSTDELLPASEASTMGGEIEEGGDESGESEPEPVEPTPEVTE